MPRTNPSYTIPSDRGFKYWDPIATDYGHNVVIYESSAANEPYLWLGIDKTGRSQIEDLSRIHLTFEQAEQIISTLRAAMAIHYQGSDSPRRKEN